MGIERTITGLEGQSYNHCATLIDDDLSSILTNVSAYSIHDQRHWHM
jgi:hypothetical protein